MKLKFVPVRGQNNVFVSNIFEAIPASVAVEDHPSGLYTRFVLRAHYTSRNIMDRDEAEVLGRYKTMDSVIYAATGHFADELNALNGVK